MRPSETASRGFNRPPLTIDWLPAHLPAMGMHTIAEAGERLRELVAEAAAGEAVVLTHEGVAVAELRAISPPRSQGPGRPVTRADLDWLAELRRGLGKPSSTDAATFISDMRDEGER